jgi:type VI secretion system secreted protein VgrG
VESKGKVLAEGKTGAQGETGWIDTEKRQQVKVYKTIMREDQKITENWQGTLDRLASTSPPDGAGADDPLDDEYIDRYGGEA